jgi:glycosyltransferase involved in cell wall biosynthesis
MPTTNPDLSLFFPAWNEEVYVERAVTRAHAVLSRLTRAFEILIIDDGSTDRTRELALALCPRFPELRVISHPVNRRLGGALKTGFSESRGAVVIYSDIDLPFDLEEVARAVRLLDYLEADMICAYRLDRTSEGPRRVVYSFVYNWLVRALFGIHLRDVNFSCKVVRRRVLEGVELRSEGSFIDAELAIRAIRAGFSVHQMGVDYFPRDRSDSVLSSPAVILEMLRELATLYPELRR